MSYYVHFTKLNPDTFVEADKVQPDKYKYTPYGKADSYSSIRQHQVSEHYYRLARRTDPQCVYLERGKVGTDAWNYTTINFVDLQGNFLKYIDPITASSSKTDPNTGDPVFDQCFKFTFDDYGELDNYNFIKIKVRVIFGDGVDIDSGSEQTYISDPIWIDENHDVKTTLFEYNSDVNKGGILFESLYPQFAFRFDSSGITPDTGGEHTVFTDQNQQVVPLYSKSSPRFEWNLGGRHGLPFSAIDTIDNGLGLPNIRIDGRRYVRAEKELSYLGGKDKHVQWRTAKLAHKDDSDYRTFRKSSIELFTRPAGYPYALNRLYLSDGFTTIGNAVKVIDDSTAEDDWVDALNAEASGLGLSGSYEFVGDVFYFVNGEDELFDVSGTIRVFARVTTLALSVPSNNDSFRYVFGYPDTNYYEHVVCWASTSGTEELLANDFGISATNTVTHSFATSGTKTVRIFTDDNETEFTLNKITGYPVKVTDITGEVPSSLRNMYINNHDFSGLPSSSLDLDFLASAKDSLRYLTINSSSVAGFGSNWASSLVSGSYKPYNKLTYIEINNNVLTSGEVDDFFVQFVDSCAVKSGAHYISLKFNSPSAPPTGTSSTQRAALAAYGWSVNTD